MRDGSVFRRAPNGGSAWFSAPKNNKPFFFYAPFESQAVMQCPPKCTKGAPFKKKALLIQHQKH